MSLIQFCWLVFFSLGFYFRIATKFSFEGNFWLKTFASFFCSFVVALFVYMGGIIFIWLGN